MKLQEVFDHLSTDFSQISIGGQEQGVINEANCRAVLRVINLGLTDLFTRFLLKESKLKLELAPSVLLYRLESAFAKSNTKSNKPIKFIDDIGNPFRDDIAKIHSVVNDQGYVLNLNDKFDKYAVHSNSTTSLEVPVEMVMMASSLPEHLKTTGLEVHYRALHPVFDTSVDADIDPEFMEVDLPYPYLHALLLFVASRTYNPVGQGAEGSLGPSYAVRYENECARLMGAKLDVETHNGNYRLKSKGFV